MPIDDRSDLDRLSRTQLYREAAAWGIDHEPDLPKYLWKNGQMAGGMVSLLESRGVNRFNMKTVQWQTVVPSDQERAAAAHQGTATSEQHYPVREAAQSQRDGVDSTAILQNRLAQADAKVELQHDENARLKAENDSLLKRLEALEGKILDQAPRGTSPRKLNRRAELFRACRTHGIPTKAHMTAADLEKLLAENPR